MLWCWIVSTKHVLFIQADSHLSVWPYLTRLLRFSCQLYVDESIHIFPLKCSFLVEGYEIGNQHRNPIETGRRERHTSFFHFKESHTEGFGMPHRKHELKRIILFHLRVILSCNYTRRKKVNLRLPSKNVILSK